MSQEKAQLPGNRIMMIVWFLVIVAMAIVIILSTSQMLKQTNDFVPDDSKLLAQGLLENWKYFPEQERAQVFIKNGDSIKSYLLPISDETQYFSKEERYNKGSLSDLRSGLAVAVYMKFPPRTVPNNAVEAVVYWK